jgi:hypothetical protein
MKKLIFLLLMAVILVGIVPAWGDTAHPPGYFDLGIITAEYNVHQDVVAQSVELVWFIPLTVEPSSLQVVMALYNDSAIRLQSGILNISDVLLIYRQAQVVSAADNFYLRC